MAESTVESLAVCSVGKKVFLWVAAMVVMTVVMTAAL